MTELRWPEGVGLLNRIVPADGARASKLGLSNHQPKGVLCEVPGAFLHRVIFSPPCNSWLCDFMDFVFIACFNCMINARTGPRINVQVLGQTGEIKLS
jgi:hypothetical protein